MNSLADSCRAVRDVLEHCPPGTPQNELRGSHCGKLVRQVHVSLIGQLEAMGGLEEWAVYVAAHLPGDSPGGGPGARDGLIRHLLQRHAPAWAASGAKRGFLLERLGLPAEWLAHALALWAAYRRDRPGVCCLVLAVFLSRLFSWSFSPSHFVACAYYNATTKPIWVHNHTAGSPLCPS